MFGYRHIAIAVAWLVQPAAFLSTGFAQPAACAPFPGCLYTPGPPLAFNTNTSSASYTDVAGQTRTINFAIRTPAVAGSLPVVIWSHGGARGHSNALGAMREWSEVTAKAGYLTISIAHTARNIAEWQGLCNALGVTFPDDCAYLNWDRPHDIRRILTELVQMNNAGPLQGRIDLSRIAVGGHSAGSGGALSVAGARRLITSNLPPEDLSSPYPIAFLAFSPQGPGSAGFFETAFRQPFTSWDPITRPVLVVTGEGDNTCGGEQGSCSGGETPSRRRIGFERMPAGDKYLMYVNDTDTYHGLFGSLSTNCVAAGVAPAKCVDFEKWLASTAIAFLDAQLKGVLSAQFWLSQSLIETASGGVVSLQKK